MRVHPLNSDIPKPERFTYPFCYEPHPLCLLAAEEVKREIERISPTEGKMFGVLVVEECGGYGFLAAYSGLLEGRNDWEYFVPPVFDAQQPDAYFKSQEHIISSFNQQISEAEHLSLITHNLSLLKAQRKQLSEELQLWLFRQYRMLNAKDEEKDLVEIWQDYHCSPKIRNKYPLPPGGTGDCCAPKLLQYAYQNGLKPLCMAEFWWGPSPKSEIRQHGEFYPACRGKCKPVLTWMLQGLEVDPNPEEADIHCLIPDVVYEDDVLVVLDKPSGMLSVPGRTGRYSVAAWAQERWPGAMLVHRLDMGTSGILIVAKNDDAYHSLQRQFEERTIKKKYIAIVEGVPEKEHGIIDLPLLNDPVNRPRQLVDYVRGKRAITEYRLLSILPSPYSLLALYPHTGRTHQLRMHCAHPDGLACPILGDELYGHKSDRLYLQAQAISFVHPVTGKKMRIELPEPLWKAQVSYDVCQSCEE